MDFLNDPEAYDKQEELKAMHIAAGALIRFGERYAELAAKQAAAESDPQRRLELEKISSVCRNVPAHAPSDLQEAVQSFQQALDALKTEKDARGISTYDSIIGREVPGVGLAQLQYLTEEWAPYNFEEKGTVSGIGVGILEAVFADIGVNRSREDVQIVPLAEGFREVQNGSSVLFSIVRSPEREPLYQWVGPFTRGSFVVYAQRHRNLTITSGVDLNLYRIGAVEGTIENTLLADRGVNASRIINAPEPKDLLEMLEAGQIDLWATGDLAGRHQMLNNC